MHDPLNVADLLRDELHQLTESGYDTSSAHRDHLAIAADDVVGQERLFAQLGDLSRLPDWSFEEPDDLEMIEDSRGGGAETAAAPDAERIRGSWLGRAVGCNLGKPLEDGDHWTPGHIRRYLELGHAYPLRDYVPLLQPMPAEFRLKDNWPETTKGRIDGSARDDDIDYSILGLHLLERHGSSLTTEHVAEAWLAFLPYSRIFTAERASYVNLLHGIPVRDVGGHRNPYREWIGALIRGDAFGWAHPGQPFTAARAAYTDAVLSHRGNGIYGEMWAAALVASALDSDDAAEVIRRSVAVVPPRSRLAESITAVMSMHDEGLDWHTALSEIRQRYGHYSWVHTVNNAAAITAGLLWSGNDFATAVGNTVQAGWDTDSNGATVGSVMGALFGPAAIPARFSDPLRDFTRSAVFGYDNSSLSGLAARTFAMSSTRA
ncbi:MAG: ADP-ribosylglycohydrolase family protein [Microbacteriaceae bacterium]|nr:ADP-ribosylglycohydrolase family protein [Microbacteriaceae bacterium]